MPKADWPYIGKRYEAGENSTDIAKEYNCAPSTICSGLLRNGFQLRPQRLSKLRGKPKQTRAQECARYYKKKRDQICARMKRKYWKDPDKYRAKSRSAIGTKPPAGIFTKQCNRCGVYKLFKEFGRRPSGKYRLRARCKVCECADAKKYREKNPIKVRLQYKKWREKTPVARRREIRNRSNAKGMKKPHIKLRSILRKQLLEILKSKGIRRSSNESAVQLVGCSISYLKKHLESQFTEGMHWGNHGVQYTNGPRKWHIDHIIGVKKFNLSVQEERRKCFHFTNLQPMWAIPNIQKG